MSILDWFSSGPKAAEKVLDAGISGLDKLILTDEEKKELSLKAGKQWVDLQKVLGEESTVRSVTRRVLAIMVMSSFTVLVFAAAIAYSFDPEYAKFLVDLADGKFGWLVLAVGGFYFGPHMVGRMFDKKGDD